MAIRRDVDGGTSGRSWGYVGTRPERAEAPSPGQRPWVAIDAIPAPCKGKSFKTSSKKYKAFALTGRIGYILKTQGVALG